MKKIIAALLIIVSLVCMAGCSTSMYSSFMLKQSGNINRWEVSWYKMNGNLTKHLYPTENDVLEYTMEGDLDDVIVIVSQGDKSVELDSEKNTLDLQDFEAKGILITVLATKANKTKLTFKLVKSE